MVSLDVRALNIWRKVLVEGVRSESPDLSARQLALMLTVYLQDGDHTVRGLAGVLNISKPAISRALDRLSTLQFIKRCRDEKDKRNVLVERTLEGSAFLTQLVQMIEKATVAATSDQARKTTSFLEAREDESAEESLHGKDTAKAA